MPNSQDPSGEARQRILDATTEALAVRSAQFFKLRDIADQAGVSPALVLRYFKSKDELVFQAIVRKMNTDGRLALDAWAQANPNAPPSDFTEMLFRMDLQNGHRTRDLMTMQWWWSSVEEEAFQNAIAPRRAHHWRLLLRHYGLAETTEDEHLRTLCRLLAMVYLDCLRRAGVLRRNQDESLAEMRVLTKPLHEAIATRAAHLRAQLPNP